ncbi:MAG: VWA domain-containing protein [Nanoarchaeota archaeon]
MEITFAKPIYLVLLVSIPFLVITHFFTYLHVRKRAMRFANFDAIRRVTGGDRKLLANTVFISRNLPVLISRVFILLFLILSAAGPILWYTGAQADSSFMLAIDTSSSMLATDITPNRLVAAKEAADGFLGQLHSKVMVGLLAFGGTSEVKVQPTEKLGEVKTALPLVDLSRSGGTDLGGAIVTSINLMIPQDRSKSVIVLTDGRGNVGTPLEEAIAYAQENRVRVHAIGIGTKEGGSFMKTLAVSKLDEETLKDLADQTGGSYHSAESQDQLDQAFLDIATFHQERMPLRLSMGLMTTALVLLFLEWGLINTKYRTVP